MGFREWMIIVLLAILAIRLIAVVLIWVNRKVQLGKATPSLRYTLKRELFLIPVMLKK